MCRTFSRSRRVRAVGHLHPSRRNRRHLRRSSSFQLRHHDPRHLSRSRHFRPPRPRHRCLSPTNRPRKRSNRRNRAGQAEEGFARTCATVACRSPVNRTRPTPAKSLRRRNMSRRAGLSPPIAGTRLTSALGDRRLGAGVRQSLGESRGRRIRPGVAAPMALALGDVIVVPFPVTDQTAIKRRLAVVVSSEAYTANARTSFSWPSRARFGTRPRSVRWLSSSGGRWTAQTVGHQAACHHHRGESRHQTARQTGLRRSTALRDVLAAFLGYARRRDQKAPHAMTR